MSDDTDTRNGTPSTPPDDHSLSSQQSLPSTEGPTSPIDPVSSLKTELNDDRIPPSQVIPSSLTPPPSSQVPQITNCASYISSQRVNMFSPPATTRDALRRDPVQANTYLPSNARQINDDPVEEVRAMLQACLAENAKLKMETAHHKLQYNLLSLQADEDAKRSQVEHEMTRREVEVLRLAENSRQAKRELSAAQESTQARYLQLKACYEDLIKDYNALVKRSKLANKVIAQKEDEIISLRDERELLLTRIRENREHFHMLCSPGGAFHGALTPKTPAVASPQQCRATPRQTPRTVRHDNAGFDALLQALNHDNNSAPSTPTTVNRPAPRMHPRHTRGVQSLSSLPTTPATRPHGEHSALLPSVDLVPQTEPPARFGVGSGSRVMLGPSKSKRGPKSRESTISDDENDEVARNELARVAAATQSFMSHTSRGSARLRRHDEQEEEVFESQASQAASEMLRRGPRESFEGEVSSSVASRDGTPAPAEKSAKLQHQLFAPVNKPGMEKRKFSGNADGDATQRGVFTSPTKRLRYAGGSEANPKIGLGIQYGQEA